MPLTSETVRIKDRPLTARERGILTLVSLGYTYAEVGDQLEESVSAIVGRVCKTKKIFQSTDRVTLTAMVVDAFRRGEIQMPARRVADKPTRRQLEVLQLLAIGFTTQETADCLAITLQTVRAHLGDAAKLMGVPGNKPLMVMLALREGWIELPEQ